MDNPTKNEVLNHAMTLGMDETKAGMFYDKWEALGWKQKTGKKINWKQYMYHSCYYDEKRRKAEQEETAKASAIPISSSEKGIDLLKDVLKLEEISSIIGINPGFVKKEVENRRMGAYRFGDHFLIPKDDLAKYVKMAYVPASDGNSDEIENLKKELAAYKKALEESGNSEKADTITRLEKQCTDYAEKLKNSDLKNKELRRTQIDLETKIRDLSNYKINYSENFIKETGILSSYSGSTLIDKFNNFKNEFTRINSKLKKSEENLAELNKKLNSATTKLADVLSKNEALELKGLESEDKEKKDEESIRILQERLGDALKLLNNEKAKVASLQDHLDRKKANCEEEEHSTVINNSEPLFYPTELKEFILSLAVKEMARIANDKTLRYSRKMDLLKSIIDANPNPNNREPFENELKKAVIECFDKGSSIPLTRIGFEGVNEAKSAHYKFRYNGDSRYTITAARTTRDCHAAKNLASETVTKLSF